MTTADGVISKERMEGAFAFIDFHNKMNLLKQDKQYINIHTKTS